MDPFQKIELRKTRNFSEKLNITFEFIRQNFRQFIPAILFISVPLYIIGKIIISYYQNFIMPSSVEGSDVITMVGGMFGFFFLAYLFIGLGYLFNASLIYNYVRLYGEREDPRLITVSDIWEYAKKDIGSLFVAGLLVGIVSVVGFFVFVIPGIYLGVTLSLITSVIIFERKSVGDAFSRCFTLIKDKWWSTFGLLFIAALIQGSMGAIFNIPEIVFTFIITFHRESSDFISDPPLWQQTGILLSACLSAIGAGLLSCISYLALAFQYFNLSERLEAAGLMARIETFGSQQDKQEDAREHY